MKLFNYPGRLYAEAARQLVLKHPDLRDSIGTGYVSVFLFFMTCDYLLVFSNDPVHSRTPGTAHITLKQSMSHGSFKNMGFFLTTEQRTPRRLQLWLMFPTLAVATGHRWYVGEGS